MELHQPSHSKKQEVLLLPPLNVAMEVPGVLLVDAAAGPPVPG